VAEEAEVAEVAEVVEVAEGFSRTPRKTIELV
jgi:hypothetical protein